MKNKIKTAIQIIMVSHVLITLTLIPILTITYIWFPNLLTITAIKIILTNIILFISNLIIIASPLSEKLEK